MNVPENKDLHISLEKLFKEMKLGTLNLSEAKLEDFCYWLGYASSEIQQQQSDLEFYSIMCGSKCGIFFDKKTRKVFDMDIQIQFENDSFGNAFPKIPLFLDCDWEETATLLTYHYLENYLKKNQIFFTKYFLPYHQQYESESNEIHIVWHNEQMSVWFIKPFKYHRFVINRIKYRSIHSLKIADLHKFYLKQF